MGYAYNSQGGWTATHQMSINGKFDDINRDDLLTFARQNNIKEAESIIDEVRDTISQWPEMAKTCGVPSETVNRINKNLLQ